MEARELTREELERKYPPSIIEWEMKHGIIRYEKNGTTYVCCGRPYEEVLESIRKESEQRETRRRLKERGLAK